ncbi:MAG: ferritin-like domain-containing protein [Tsuneonella suprasediminis]|uniref:ferritin-like domain-containing protein n=1 Tax=Tsuneonella flava TaxID=2055955 RepID=UPI001CC2055A|nr:DUF2202 domain-containing protein [Tsuneonella flava]UBS33017.1 DUF2202 domain-containing protein [Altererythrobacter sp. N1]
MNRFMSVLVRQTFAPLTIAIFGSAVAWAAPSPPPAAQSTGDRAALQTALDDEYRAEATYRAVLDQFGDVRPFSNIIRAEQRHAEMVTAQMVRLGMTVPPNRYIGTIAAPKTLLDACQTGVEAEKANIALYDRLLPQVRDPQVKATLQLLQSASRENHLPAFERCVARGGMMGRGW